MATYAILEDNEFIISLSEPAISLVKDFNKQISLCIRNPHHNQGDRLAHTILTKLLTQCIDDSGDKSESREESRLQSGDYQ